MPHGDPHRTIKIGLTSEQYAYVSEIAKTRHGGRFAEAMRSVVASDMEREARAEERRARRAGR